MDVNDALRPMTKPKVLHLSTASTRVVRPHVPALCGEVVPVSYTVLYSPEYVTQVDFLRRIYPKRYIGRPFCDQCLKYLMDQLHPLDRLEFM